MADIGITDFKPLLDEEGSLAATTGASRTMAVDLASAAHLIDAYFDDGRRSAAWLRIPALRRHEMLTEAERHAFSDETRGVIADRRREALVAHLPCFFRAEDSNWATRSGSRGVDLHDREPVMVDNGVG